MIVNGQKTKYLICTRKNYNLEELHINSMYLEQVQSYKYLGSTLNSDNSIEEEIRNRITLGNKAYYANQFLFKSRLVFERKVLRKIFGPTKESDGTWRIKTNYELDKLIRT
jgi:hypothetical protein